VPTIVITWFDFRTKRSVTTERQVADLRTETLEPAKDLIESQYGPVLRIDTQDGRRLYKSGIEITDLQ